MTQSTVRLTMAQALVRYLCNQFTEIDGERLAAVCRRLRDLRARQRHLPVGGARSRPGHAAHLARPERAVDGAGRDRLRQGQAAPADHGRSLLDRTRRHQHGHRRGPRAREPPAGAAPRRRHLRQPPARPGDAAGRALRKPDDHGERRLQAGLPLLGPHHAARADHRLAAAGGGRDARSRRLRPGLPVALPGHPGGGLRLSRGLLHPHRLVDPAPAPRPRPAGRGGGAAQDGEEAAHHLRRRRALLPGRRDGGAVRRSTAASRSPRPSPARAPSPTTIRRMSARSASSARPRPTRWPPKPTSCWRSAPGSWTSPPAPGRVFNHDARIIGINAARWDATKHRALAVVGDARETVAELDAALGDWKAPAGWTANARKLMGEWNELVDDYQKPTNAPVPTYAQVIAAVHAAAKPTDPIITAAGGLPGELVKGWRVKAPNTFDCEFGYSCMGYEIAAGWGYAMARPGTTPIVMVGDGTYMMMNSDVYSIGPLRPQVHRDRLRQRRLRRHQPPAERQGHARLQQPDPRLQGGRALRRRLRQARRVDGRPRAPLRKPRRPRRRNGLGARHRPHHGDQHRHRRLRLGAGRRGLGRGRARGLRAGERARGPGQADRNPAPSSAWECNRE